MARERRPSRQTAEVLAALAADPSAWRHGYELGLEVGLRSGSLYPILVRLSDRDLLESRWEADPPAGRPPRHLYRLTATGLEYAAAHARAAVARGAARSAPQARAQERVIAALFVLAAVLLTVPAVVRAGRRARRTAEGDAPARLLAFAVTGLPETHHQWGRAMSAELQTVCGRGARWRFALGCARAAGVIRARVTLTSRDRGGGGLRTGIGVGVMAAVALGGYGLVRYPGLRSGDASISPPSGSWRSCSPTPRRRSRSRAGRGLPEIAARRHGLVGGVAIGAAWLVVLSPTETLKQWVLVPLMIALLGPGCVAALAARDGKHVTAGTRAALWSGIVGGLLVFTVWMTATYARDGRPYDAQLLRDFPRSGAPDLATLAVSDALASALTLLILIPLTAVAFGSLGARLPRTTGPDRA